MSDLLQLSKSTVGLTGRLCVCEFVCEKENRLERGEKRKEESSRPPSLPSFPVLTNCPGEKNRIKEKAFLSSLSFPRAHTFTCIRTLTSSRAAELQRETTVR
mmetsp:Transcript_13484/g.26699  ORF Transcript_13484/g.26699 Transcript_13484/m.26699 type:complete len:102 (+) Transcript_13484:707-1012(+)